MKDWWSTPRPQNTELAKAVSELTGDPCPYILNCKDYFIDPSVLLEYGLSVRSHEQRYCDIIVTQPGGYHWGVNRNLCVNIASNYADSLEWPPYGIRLKLCNGRYPCNKRKDEK
jgi:hypothetical protein